MLLESTNVDNLDNVPEITADETVAYLGEDSELVALVSESDEEMSNLTYAMLRLEHRSVVTENAELLNEGVKEFFTKAINTIKAYWAKFKAWILRAVDVVINKIFGPRKAWLEKNEAALKSKSNFGDAKVSVGENLIGASSKYSSLVTRAETEIKKISDVAAKGGAGEGSDRVRKAAFAAWGGDAGKDSLPKVIVDGYVGAKSTEAKLDSGTVGKLIDIAKITFDNGPKMKALSKIADLQVALAEQNLKVKGPGDEKRAAVVLRSIQSTGSVVSQIVTGIKAANEKANAQAMSALTRALHASGGEAKKDDKDKGVKNEDGVTSVLDSFM